MRSGFAHEAREEAGLDGLLRDQRRRVAERGERDYVVRVAGDDERQQRVEAEVERVRRLDVPDR